MATEEELRTKLLYRPTREDIVLTAMVKYNAALAETRETINTFAEKNHKDPRIVFLDTVKKLPQMILDDEKKATPEVLKKARERTATLALLTPLISEVQEGRDLEKVLADIPVPSRVPHYEKYMTNLEKRGIVVVPIHSVVNSLSLLLPYQILRLGKQYSIPAPLSQTLLKEPGISIDEAVEQFVQFYMKKEEERRVVTVRRGMGRRAYQDRVAKEVEKQMRIYKEENLQRLSEQAREVISSMPQFQRLGLTRSAAMKYAIGQPDKRGRVSLTESLLQEHQLTPEKVFAAAYATADPEATYLTAMYHGVERSRQHVLVMDNCEAAMRLLMYHILQKKKRDPILFNMSSPYANCVEGTVSSRSSGNSHAVSVTALPIFSSEENIVWRTAFDTEPRCRCKDAEYMAELHAKAQYAFIYTDTHALTLAYYAMREAEKSEGRVINLFPLPTIDAAIVSWRMEHQLLIDSKIDGSVYPANKAERELLKMKVIGEKGYQRTCTHNLIEGYTAIQRTFLR